MVLERRAWTGRLGESLVVAELEQQGHRILQRNWRWRRAEVDVISTDGTALVFHEVKCRSGRDTLTLDPMMWWPHVAQQRRLVQAAHAFVRQQPGTPGRLRFDVWLVESVSDKVGLRREPRISRTRLTPTPSKAQAAEGGRTFEAS